MSSIRAAANPLSANTESAASRISCGRASFRRRHRALPVGGGAALRDAGTNGFAGRFGFDCGRMTLN
jgi:hypothetical protein